MVAKVVANRKQQGHIVPVIRGHAGVTTIARHANRRSQFQNGGCTLRARITAPLGRKQRLTQWTSETV
jgi:hypothetical protein